MPTIHAFERRFQSTRPVKGATLGTGDPQAEAEFQSTRPVKGATVNLVYMIPAAAVSIHAPREGRDPSTSSDGGWFVWFQSTRPVKGATPPA